MLAMPLLPMTQVAGAESKPMIRDIEALREVFTGTGPHKNDVPTEEQRKRFTVLYPKD